MAQKCYWCGKNSTSREHVPPKCLFPESKDISPLINLDCRKSLITVPSCDEHNLAKSNDDEYLLICLASKVGNNSLAFWHTNTKIARAIKRNPNLIDVLEEGDIAVNKTNFPVQIVNINTYRLRYSLETVARALSFHKTGLQFTGKCTIISTIFANSNDDANDNFFKKSVKTIEEERVNWSTKIEGENPQVFQYHFSNCDCYFTYTIALIFYERLVV